MACERGDGCGGTVQRVLAERRLCATARGEARPQRVVRCGRAKHQWSEHEDKPVEFERFNLKAAGLVPQHILKAYAKHTRAISKGFAQSKTPDRRPMKA